RDLVSGRDRKASVWRPWIARRPCRGRQSRRGKLDRRETLSRVAIGRERRAPGESCGGGAAAGKADAAKIEDRSRAVGVRGGHVASVTRSGSGKSAAPALPAAARRWPLST